MKKIKLFLLGLTCMASAIVVNAQNAVHFDGTDDFIQTTYSGVLGTTNRTFEAWIYVDASAPASNLTIIDYGLNAIGSRNTFVVKGDRGISFLSGGTNGNISSSSTGLILDNQWTHVAFVLDNGAGFLYVDGVQVGTGNLSGVNTPSGNANLTIGERVSGGSIPFHGKIDEVRVWNIARTAAEIAADMNNEFACGIPTGLVAYHKFNQGTAGGTNTGLTTSIDDSGLGNDGTLTGFALTGATSNWVTGMTLNTVVTATQVLVECNGFSITVGSNTYTTTGIYQDTLVGASVAGCDSIVTTDLTIGIDNSTSLIGVTITASATGATYQWVDCNNGNAYITGETGQSFIATANGSYAVEITAGSCTDTSACVSMSSIGTYNNGVNFDGVDDVITTNYSGIAGNNPRTVEAWVKAPLTTGQVVITDWGTMGTGTRFTFALINGMMRVEVQGSGQSGTTIVADNTWHHVAVTYDNAASPNNYSMYIDGVLEISFNLATALNTGATVPFQIGMRIDGAKAFAGTIDEVKVWDYARTQTEITTDMNAEYCTAPTGLVAYHKLNNGIANGINTVVTTSVDESGLGNDGTLTGFALTGTTSNWVAGTLASTTVTGSQTLTECDGFSITVGANTYTTTGIYQDTLVGGSVNGCDSIVTTDLTVAAAINVATSTSGYVITATVTGASYQWIDCNNSNAYISGETGQSYTATATGSYAVEVTVGNCVDTSLCENITIVGTNDNDFNTDIKLFPNPTNGDVSISVANLTGTVQINVLDITGKSVLSVESKKSNTVLDMNHLNDGVYFIQITNNDNHKTVRLIKL